MKLAILLLGITLIVGCGPAMVNPNSDVSVGIVNGKELRRVCITGDGTVHYVYYFPTDPNQPVSNNFRSGKTGSVAVSIDNKF